MIEPKNEPQAWIKIAEERYPNEIDQVKELVSAGYDHGSVNSEYQGCHTILAIIIQSLDKVGYKIIKK